MSELSDNRRCKAVGFFYGLVFGGRIDQTGQLTVLASEMVQQPVAEEIEYVDRPESFAGFEAAAVGFEGVGECDMCIAVVFDVLVVFGFHEGFFVGKVELAVAFDPGEDSAEDGFAPPLFDGGGEVVESADDAAVFAV